MNTTIREALLGHNVKEIVCMMGHNRVHGIGITVYRFRPDWRQAGSYATASKNIIGQPMLYVDGNWVATVMVPRAMFDLDREITLLDTCYY